MDVTHGLGGDERRLISKVGLWVPSSPARRKTGWPCVYLSPDPQLRPLDDANGE